MDASIKAENQLIPEIHKTFTLTLQLQQLHPVLDLQILTDLSLVGTFVCTWQPTVFKLL